MGMSLNLLSSPNIMTQATDTDIRELKDLILGLDKKIDAIDRKVDDVRTDIRVMDTRLIEVEKKVDKLDGKIDKQDNRLWTFGGIILTASLTALGKLIFFPNP
jgi:peptidoglycan hydrolase CwlO-like protein